MYVYICRFLLPLCVYIPTKSIYICRYIYTIYIHSYSIHLLLYTSIHIYTYLYIQIDVQFYIQIPNHIAICICRYTHGYTPSPKVSTCIYPDSNIPSTYTSRVRTHTHCIWVGCQGGAHMNQGDENSVPYCLPVRCPSLFLSLPLAPSLSLLSSLVPQSLKRALERILG